MQLHMENTKWQTHTHNSPTTKARPGQSTGQGNNAVFVLHTNILPINILGVFKIFSPFKPTPFVLLPILRQLVYKYCSAGLTKILTALKIKSNHVIATVGKRSNSALLIKKQ